MQLAAAGSRRPVGGIRRRAVASFRGKPCVMPKASKWRDGQTDCMFDKEGAQSGKASAASRRNWLPNDRCWSGWGDSHSAALSPLLRELATSRRLPIWQASLAGLSAVAGDVGKGRLRFNQQDARNCSNSSGRGGGSSPGAGLCIYGDPCRTVPATFSASRTTRRTASIAEKAAAATPEQVMIESMNAGRRTS